MKFSRFALDSHSLGQIAANGDLVTEAEMTGECNPGQPSIEDFNNPSLYGPASEDNLPQIHWEIAGSIPAVMRDGVDVTAVRSTVTWEHTEYHPQPWVNEGICVSNTGQLGEPSVVCQEMVGTYSACESACSSTVFCMAFTRDSTADVEGQHICHLLADATDTTNFPLVDGQGVFTFVKQHTVLVPDLWNKTQGGVGQKSRCMHSSGCYELHFEHDGFEVDINCLSLSLEVPPPFGPYMLHFKSDSYRCEPFKGRGDYIRYAFSTCVICAPGAGHALLCQ